LLKVITFFIAQPILGQKWELLLASIAEHEMEKYVRELLDYALAKFKHSISDEKKEIMSEW
jgi:hypothetical protein